MTAINVTLATTAELVAFYNANTGGAQVKKFADRKTAERRVNLLIEEMIQDSDLEALNDYSKGASQVLADEIGSEEPAQAEISESNQDLPADYAPLVAPVGSNLTHEAHDYLCPHCGVDLNNGVGEHLQEVNGKPVKHDKYQFECLACGGEFGPVIKPAKVSVSTGKTRIEMAKSLKLDRAIQEATTGHVYANACQVWKSGLVSSSQCDRLSATLYGAAKQGNRLMSVTVNGHVFTLVNK